MTHTELLKKYRWRPIPGCPGRYTLISEDYSSFQIYYKSRENIKEHTSPTRKDIVLVSILEDGGLVSYRKEDGFLVHTLCNKEGFDRILGKLGI